LILVTGSSGFVGKRLCYELVKRDYKIKGVSRKENVLDRGFTNIQVQSIDGTTDWTKVLKNVETVIHLAARVHVIKDISLNPYREFHKVNVEGTLNLANQAKTSGVKRFIYISSIKANGENTKDKPFVEKFTSVTQDPYGLSKRTAEESLVQIAGLEHVIIRPPLIYGPGVKANFRKLIDLVERGRWLPLGGVNNKRSFLGVSNFIDLIIKCIDSPNAANKTFLVSDQDDISTPELISRIAESMDQKAKLFYVPPFLLKLAGILMGKSSQVNRLCDSLQVNTSSVTKSLNWKAPFTMQEELREVIKDYKKGGSK